LKLDLHKVLNGTFILVGAMVGVSSVADDDQYRWENDRGVPVFSDRPPVSDSNYEVISEPGLKTGILEDEDDITVEVEPGASDDFDASVSAAEGAEGKDTALCEQARMNIIALEAPRQVNVSNDRGETREMSPQEREVATQTAKAQIAVYCE
jgi:hypothetical protein